MASPTEDLSKIQTFPQLVRYLRDELDWPIETESFEDLTFDYSAEELGIDSASAAKIEEIKRLRPLSVSQPWGIFFVKFEPKRLPVVALRRILGSVVLKERASANHAERAAWDTEDLLFISNYGTGEKRQISFAHFAQDPGRGLPTLKVLGWDNLDTPLHIEHVVDTLRSKLVWPHDERDVDAWQATWRSAFTLRYREVITTSRTLAIRLAQLARGIRNRIRTVVEIETAEGPVTQQLKAFRETLVHDLDADGFADMYAQTIAYGLLTSRVTSPTVGGADALAAQLPVTNPFLKDLLEEFLHRDGRSEEGARGPRIDFDELGVGDVIELLDNANMEAVVRDFGDRNPQEDPVIHFYELFLKEYDAKKRMQRGVFYTPRPVVSFIVRSVHELLQTDFGLADGLADTASWGEMARRHVGLTIPDGMKPSDRFVTILDPATGTGTFLVEAIEIIHRTLVDKWAHEGRDRGEILDQWNQYVPEHLLPRLYGYELLMAPYAIAHLKVGLKLHETGYRFESAEPVRVFLTNSLEPAEDFSDRLEFAIPALAHEARTVNHVKRHQRFTVVFGNPPYSAVSSNLTPVLRRIVDPYRFVDRERIRERSMLQFEKNIQDDYVKFFAFSQDRARESGVGVTALITNHSYLDGPTLRGLRWNLLTRSSHSRFLDLHGNANKAEVAPDGMPDQNVFDIRQGVAISAMVIGPGPSKAGSVEIGELWGSRADKYRTLSSQTLATLSLAEIEPTAPFYYLVDTDGGEFATNWAAWPSVPDLFTKRSTGTETGFDNLLIAFERSELIERVERFSDPTRPSSQVEAEFNVDEGHAATLFARRRELGSVRADEYKPFQLRPYDFRWALLRKELLKTNSFNVMLDLHRDSPGLVTTRQTKEAFAAFAVEGFCGHKLTSSYDRSYVFPLFTQDRDGLMAIESVCLNPTLFSRFRSVASLAPASPLDERDLALRVLWYSLATLNAPTYTRHFRSQLKREWPRIPLPSGTEMFTDLAQLGQELGAIQTLESVRPNSRIGSYSGPSGPVVGAVNWTDDSVWLDWAVERIGARVAVPGAFHGVPAAVWNFHIGGYQVCEKWLKDRRGRTLSQVDVAHYQKILVAVTETIRLMKEIDEVIDRHGGWPGAFALVTDDEALSLPP